MSRRERATFNLLMVESGWAAPFPIYPSLPQYEDLVMVWETAKEAHENGKGAWAGPMMLTGYEFRMCQKLYNFITGARKKRWIERFCVNMLTKEIFYPQEYYKVPAYNRIFIWPWDVSEAVGMLNLVPPE